VLSRNLWPYSPLHKPLYRIFLGWQRDLPD
jgi:hypothetical protein